MKFKVSLIAGLALAGMLAGCAPELDPKSAGAATRPAMDPTPEAAGDIQTIRTKLATLLPEIDQNQIEPSAAPGLYQVRQGSFYGYVTADGRYLISGDMVNIETGEEVTENFRRSERVAGLAELGDANMIEFAPAQDKKYTVTVFTDVDCGYCRKLHSEIAQYNEKGIAIRYVFYPRSGPKTPSFTKAEAIWCSADRKAALTMAKAGAPVAGKTDCENPIQREFDLGQEFGLRGTPMMILPDGEIVNGYVPANTLAQRLAALETAAAGTTAVQ